ncbi:MAG TPA: hypothetical protein VHC70_15630 [Phycisphaerales bacterium]|nr:hypothetical protein [Phycisphaerales bacterium]
MAVSLLAGCASQERVTKYKPFFTGLQDAEFGHDKPVNPEDGRIDPSLRNGEMKSVVERPDGSKIYLTYSPMQLFAHIQNLLDEGTPEADRAILDQLIDEKTKEHYRTHSQDPIGYIAYLHENRKQLAKSLARMPMGEHSPTVIVDQPGDRQWVLNITGQAADGLKFTHIWIRQDMGQWKLEWLK